MLIHARDMAKNARGQATSTEGADGREQQAACLQHDAAEWVPDPDVRPLLGQAGHAVAAGRRAPLAVLHAIGPDLLVQHPRVVVVHARAHPAGACALYNLGARRS